MKKKIQLFCLPYAGGSSLVFKDWKNHFSPRIEIIPIEFAGRGKRIHENGYSDIDEAVDDVFRFLKNNVTTPHYALFGHSLGAFIAYFVCQKIIDTKFQLPVHVFFSGKGAITAGKASGRKVHLLDNEDFIEEILSLGGTPPEFFEHPELLELFLPVLRNDFRIAESEVEHLKIQPLDIDISAFFGTNEDLTNIQKNNWKLHTTKSCSLHYFEGGHFFINDQIKAVTKQIGKELNSFDTF
ncbi:MAG: thioesterase domain-containing protein [Rikenellaceae bacterium]|nr:thioesterase domain-containing protein [Rikenellaceae bacterium]